MYLAAIFYFSAFLFTPSSSTPIHRTLTHQITICNPTAELASIDTSTAVNGLLTSTHINSTPQTLLGQRYWSGVSDDVWAYIVNDSPCPQTLLSASDVRMLFGSLELDCADRGGVAYWVHGSGEGGEGREEKIEVGLVEGMEGRQRLWVEGRSGTERDCER